MSQLRKVKTKSLSHIVANDSKSTKSVRFASWPVILKQIASSFLHAMTEKFFMELTQDVMVKNSIYAKS
jgi:hypothetical protein